MGVHHLSVGIACVSHKVFDFHVFFGFQFVFYSKKIVLIVFISEKMISNRLGYDDMKGKVQKKVGKKNKKKRVPYQSKEM